MINLMLVEDEVLERKALAYIIYNKFKNINIVHETLSGQDAVEYESNNDVDIIIMDIEMPGINGLEAAQIIRKRNPNCFIIILTAYSEFNYAKAALDARVYKYLLKPVLTSELEATLNEVIEFIMEKKQGNDEIKNIINLNDEINVNNSLLLAFYNNDFNSALDIVKTLWVKLNSKSLREETRQSICTEVINKSIHALKEKTEYLKEDIIPLFNYSKGNYFTSVQSYLFEVCKTISNQKNRRATNFRVIERVKDIVATNYNNELTLEQVAEMVCLNSDYLSRIFKQIEGINFKEYFINARIEKAKQLLEQGSLSIKEISYHVGYSNPNYFSRAFKKAFGMTAVEYKNLVVAAK